MAVLHKVFLPVLALVLLLTSNSALAERSTLANGYLAIGEKPAR